MLSMRNINKIEEVQAPHQENFEMIIEAPKGIEASTNNFGTCLDRLERHLRFSQHESSSMITGFTITKVVRNENGDIISTTLVIDHTKKTTKLFHKSKFDGRVVVSVDYNIASNEYSTGVSINGNYGFYADFDNADEANERAASLFDSAVCP